MSSTTPTTSQSPLLPSPPATESSMANSRRNAAIKSRAWADIRRRRRRSGKKRSARAREEVSKKLEALKNLIPSTRGECRPTETVAADELFRETADYILWLKDQVVLLQNLIQIYGSPDQFDRDNAGRFLTTPCGMLMSGTVSSHKKMKQERSPAVESSVPSISAVVGSGEGVSGEFSRLQ